MLKIISERLVLRSFIIEDAEVFSTYRSDPEVARYQGWDTPFTFEQATRFINEMSTKLPGVPGEWYQLAITLKKNERVIGDCAFKILQDSIQQAELGITLAARFQGNGFAYEALISLINYLFMQYDLHRVQANCDEENFHSYNLLNRLGFREEAHFKENLWFKGRWSSEYWFAVLRREWDAKRTEKD